jgi:Ca2+-binding EF-hand superfamily protein
MWHGEFEELFEKLAIDRLRCFELYKTFLKMDKDQSSEIDTEEVMKYLGGSRTKFTDRIYHIERQDHENRHIKPTMQFKQFVIKTWNFLSMSTYHLARLAFEIFDPDEEEIIYREDIESMFKMMYASDDHDERYIKKFRFNENNGISKSDFIKHIERRSKYIIQPMIEYQRRLRRKLGGMLMWEVIASHRISTFDVFDKESDTLEEALEGILASEDPNRLRRKLQADLKIEEERKKIEAAAAEAKRVFDERQEYLEKLRIEAEANAPDREMKRIEVILNDKKKLFRETIFTVDEIIKRHEMRAEIFELFDQWKGESKIFWEAESAKDLQLAIGTDADHKERFDDWMKSPDAKLKLKRYILKYVVDLLEEKYIDKDSKARKKKKNELEILLAKQTLVEEERRIKESDDLPASSKKYQPKELDDVMKIAKRYGTKAMFKEGQEKSSQELFDILKEDTIRLVKDSLFEARTKREMDYVRKEFEMATEFGARISRWNLLWDKVNDRMVYVNVDTLQLIGGKSAICEFCDTVFDPPDIKCKKCDRKRSGKNQKLYRKG